MVLNATFNSISAISWRSVLLVKGTGVPVDIIRSISIYIMLYFIDIHVLYYDTDVLETDCVY
jgi:hypothetical protein